MNIPTYVVIPTRNRHQMVTNLIDSLRKGEDGSLQGIIIVDNRSDPPIRIEDPSVWRVPCEDDPPNISKLWNIGIDLIRAMARMDIHQQFNIAVLNSDVVCPPGWLAGMGEGLRKYNADLAYPDQHGTISAPKKHMMPGPISLYERITGFAFMLRGESSVRLNEDLKWWYGDDDLDWRCRDMNGSVLLPGLAVEHLDPNGSTNRRPELSEQAGKDRETFLEIWGKTPW